MPGMRDDSRNESVGVIAVLLALLAMLIAGGAVFFVYSRARLLRAEAVARLEAERAAAEMAAAQRAAEAALENQRKLELAARPVPASSAAPAGPVTYAVSDQPRGRLWRDSRGDWLFAEQDADARFVAATIGLGIPAPEIREDVLVVKLSDESQLLIQRASAAAVRTVDANARLVAVQLGKPWDEVRALWATLEASGMPIVEFLRNCEQH